MRILLVDDDELLAQRLAEFLASQHYVVDVVFDGEAGWSYAQATTYDLIVLDINLPKLNGVQLCQKLRQARYSSPILLLTAQGDSSDKVVGLDAGADDYLVKPCTLTELSARIRALLRRPSTLVSPLLQAGDLSINPNTCEVTYQDQLLVLSPKEYSLLELFLRHPQRIFSSTVILEHLWNFDDTPGEETVRTHIKRLRRKLKAAGANTIIDTVYGMGYRLQAPPPPAAPSPPARETAATGLPPTAANPRETTIPELDLPGPDPKDEARQAAIALWEKFKPPILNRLISLDQAVAALRSGELSEALRQTAAGDAHKLSGSLGMFGFPEGSRLSQAIGRWLRPPTVSSENAGQLEALVAALRQELQKLPQSPAETPPLPAAAPTDPDQPPEPDPPPRRPPDLSIKVLAVDDDVTILETLQMLLPRWGIEPITLSNPLQLWEVLASEVPDLLILDVDMPDINGIDLCHLIRNDDLWNGLPILFLTAHREPQIILKLYSAGADDYVAKPFAEPELMTRIFNRIERNRLLQTWRKPSP
ncbi:response regulator [Nodosilinea nodulosa]|uniref:response regulator n=1 Tax=Nodosilinea nodulosa TaxID=416001 RepID=UPI00047465BC|nr:response regulator [Nodosilinea nodulosa]